MWLSGEYASLLEKRARAMLALAKELLQRGQPDLAALNAEYGAQLLLKALLLRLTGEEWRGHSVRALLSVLAHSLREHGFSELAEEVEGFARSFRRMLIELEEAHVRAVYGVLEYSKEQSEKILWIAEEVAKLVDRVAREVLSYGKEVESS